MRTKWCAFAAILVLPVFALAQQPNNNKNNNNRVRQDNGGWLGLAFVMESDKNRAVIHDMQPDGPAEKANLKVGDVIVRIGNMTPKDAQDFMAEVASHNPGDKITLTLMREGKEHKVDVTLGRRTNGQQ